MKKILVILMTALFSLYLLIWNSIFAADEEEDLWNSIFSEIAEEQEAIDSSSSSSVESTSDDSLNQLIDEQSSSSLDTSVEYDYSNKSLWQVAWDFVNIIDTKDWSTSVSKPITRPIQNLDVKTVYPLPYLSLVTENGKHYAKITWNISDQYDHIILVSRDWKSFENTTSKKIELTVPWRYNFTFQVMENGKYKTIHTASLDNKKIDGELVWNIKAWLPYQSYILMLIISILAYVAYRKKLIK